MDIQREFYLSAIVDRARGGLTFMLSTEGGTEIEEVAEENPDAISYIPVDAAVGVQGFQVRAAAERLGLSPKLGRNLTKFCSKADWDSSPYPEV